MLMVRIIKGGLVHCWLGIPAFTVFSKCDPFRVACGVIQVQYGSNWKLFLHFPSIKDITLFCHYKTITPDTKIGRYEELLLQ
jgi:hypothetical protein